MTADAQNPQIPFLAIPPREPQVSLVTSSITPSNEADEWVMDEATFAALPSALQDELEYWHGEAWTRGFGYFPESQSAAFITSPLAPDANDENVDEQPPAVTVQPWLIEVQETFSALRWQALDFEARIRRHLNNAISEAIEREFWSGTVAQAHGWANNYLTNSSAPNFEDVTPGAGPVSLTAGIALLQQSLGDTSAGDGTFGGQGMIHLVPEVTPNLLITRRIGKVMYDQLDNIVVPGVGYAGTGPGGDDPDAGTTWLYATDLVATRIANDIKVFPDNIAEALDRGGAGSPGNPNTIALRAQLVACAYFDGTRQFAVNVTIPS